MVVVVAHGGSYQFESGKIPNFILFIIIFTIETTGTLLFLLWNVRTFQEWPLPLSVDCSFGIVHVPSS